MFDITRIHGWNPGKEDFHSWPKNEKTQKSTSAVLIGLTCMRHHSNRIEHSFLFRHSKWSYLQNWLNGTWTKVGKCLIVPKNQLLQKWCKFQNCDGFGKLVFRTFKCTIRNYAMIDIAKVTLFQRQNELHSAVFEIVFVRTQTEHTTWMCRFVHVLKCQILMQKSGKLKQNWQS